MNTLISLFFVLIAAAAGSRAIGADLPVVQARKQLRYCYFARFGVDDPKQPRGPDCDLLVRFAEKMKLKPAPRRVRWEELFEDEKGKVTPGATYVPALFARDECDLYATSMTINDWRMKLIDMVPMHAARMMAVVRTDGQPRITKISELGGKRTIVSKSTTLHEILLQLNQTQLKDNPIHIELVSFGGTTRYLLEKKVDFILLDTSQALQFMKENPGKAKLAFTVGPNQALGWGFPKGTPRLQEAFRRFIAAERADQNSAMNRIFRQYYDVSVEEFESIVQFAQARGD